MRPIPTNIRAPAIIIVQFMDHVTRVYHVSVLHSSDIVRFFRSLIEAAFSMTG